MRPEPAGTGPFPRQFPPISSRNQPEYIWKRKRYSGSEMDRTGSFQLPTNPLTGILSEPTGIRRETDLFHKILWTYEIGTRQKRMESWNRVPVPDPRQRFSLNPLLSCRKPWETDSGSREHPMWKLRPYIDRFQPFPSGSRRFRSLSRRFRENPVLFTKYSPNIHQCMKNEGDPQTTNHFYYGKYPPRKRRHHSTNRALQSTLGWCNWLIQARIRMKNFETSPSMDWHSGNFF